MSDFLFVILEIILIFISVLIVKVGIPYFKIKVQNFIDADIFDAVTKAVKSVQQDPIFKDQLGKVKKEEVIVRVSAWAIKRGLHITEEQISQLIETAVFVMKNEGEK